MKQCSKCKQNKEASEYFKDNRTKSGLYSACKACHKEAKCDSFYVARINPTPRTVSAAHYKAIIYRLTYRRAYQNRKCTFSINLLEKWFAERWEQYMMMYKNWEAGGFTRKLAPTIDRIDTLKDYHISNIQLLTHNDNGKKKRSPYNHYPKDN